jgi:exopolysaccharide biosynthesis protein
MKNKSLTMLAALSVVILAAALVSSPLMSAYASHDKGNQKSKDKPKDPKCNNVKILVKVSNIPENTTTLVGNAQLDGKQISRTVHIEGDNQVAIPFQFKKLNPCPALGDSFSGDVNGTSFNGALKSLKKPNKVGVSLP